MDFDIYQFDRQSAAADIEADADTDTDAEDLDDLFDDFLDRLLKRFAASPEGQQRLESDKSMGFWVARLLQHAYRYLDQSVTQLTVRNVDEIVTVEFPRRISLLSDDRAATVIPELIAFWSYLKREFELPNAEEILQFLRDLEPEFVDIMLDPANFGMAKSLFRMGRDAGFDMATVEGQQAFMAHYNEHLVGQQPLLVPPLPPPAAASDKPRRSAIPIRLSDKAKRQLAAEVRKRNRSRRGSR